jgi:hypothetical protein
MELHKIAVKFFLERPEDPPTEYVIPVFHRWIREKLLGGILIDVADYGHLPQSPGVLLVAHEANWALDASEGPVGLLYTRKQPLEGDLAARIRACLQGALAACARLEEDLSFTFSTGKALFLANDRLAAPNTDASFAALKPALDAAFGALFGGAVTLVREGADPRERLAVRVTSSDATPPAGLLARLS